jgi:antitoxin MazE
MQTRIRRWGNSLALRLPKSVAEEVGVAENDTVELGVEDGRIFVTRHTPKRFVLDDLLRGITRTNRHEEIATDSPRGREVW